MRRGNVTLGDDHLNQRRPNSLTDVRQCEGEVTERVRSTLGERWLQGALVRPSPEQLAMALDKRFALKFRKAVAALVSLASPHANHRIAIG